jgi:flagellar biosynthetic protein FliR
MYALIDQIAGKLPVCMLVFIRITAMLMVIPVFGYTTVSRRVRLALALALSLIVFMNISLTAISIRSLTELFFHIARELFIGLIIGFGARLIFEALNMAGGFVGRQMGLAMANVLDPSSLENVPIVGQFWFLLAMIYFMTVNGHHYFIEIIANQFSIIPVLSGSVNGQLGRHLIDGGVHMFVIAVKIAAPVLILLLTVDTALALVARVMPQMNIFIVSLPLKLGVGLFAVLSSLNIFQLMFGVFYASLTDFVNGIVKLLSLG